MTLVANSTDVVQVLRSSNLTRAGSLLSSFAGHSFLVAAAAGVIHKGNLDAEKSMTSFTIELTPISICLMIRYQKTLEEVRRGASMMYATARFNSWVSATGWNSAEEMEESKEESIEYFASQYRSMLEDNMNDYIANFDRYVRVPKGEESQEQSVRSLRSPDARSSRPLLLALHSILSGFQKSTKYM